MGVKKSREQNQENHVDSEKTANTESLTIDIENEDQKLVQKIEKEPKDNKTEDDEEIKGLLL